MFELNVSLFLYLFSMKALSYLFQFSGCEPNKHTMISNDIHAGTPVFNTGWTCLRLSATTEV